MGVTNVTFGRSFILYRNLTSILQPIDKHFKRSLESQIGIREISLIFISGFESLINIKLSIKLAVVVNYSNFIGKIKTLVTLLADSEVQRDSSSTIWPSGQLKSVPFNYVFIAAAAITIYIASI